MQITGKIKEALFWLMAGGAFLLMIYNTMLYTRVGIRPEAPVSEIENGTTLAGFSLKELDGKDFVIPSKGRYLVSFLTTGCGPCQMQVATLNRTSDLGSYDKVLAVFFEPRAKVEQFKVEFNAEIPCLIDYKATINTRLNLSSFPQTVELDDGTVIRSWVGVHDSFSD